jgi:polysaccharide biosynthesis protein PslG
LRKVAHYLASPAGSGERSCTVPPVPRVAIACVLLAAVLGGCAVGNGEVEDTASATAAIASGQGEVAGARCRGASVRGLRRGRQRRARRLRRRCANAHRRQLFGFTDNSVSAGQLTPEQSTSISRLVKADVVRLTFDWRWAEPRKDEYYFEPYDEMYHAYLERGIRPFFTILFSPWWTWEPSVACDQWREDCTYPPAREHDAEWREIASMLARRYPKAAGIEIWNEPNVYFFWRPQPDVGRYTELQQAAYDAIKAVHPTMPVVAGGLLNVEGSSSGEVAPADFLEGIYQRGGGRSMDALNLHPYPIGLDQRFFLDSFAALRRVRNSHGEAGKPLWVTELGLSTTGAEQGHGFSAEEQARGLIEHYRAVRSMKDVELVTLYTLVEPEVQRGTEAEEFNLGFGLIDRSLRPKPAFCALAAERGTSWDCTPGAPLP